MDRPKQLWLDLNILPGEDQSMSNYLRGSWMLGAMVLILLSANMPAIAAADTPLISRIRAEAPAAWQEYRHANRFAQGVLRLDAKLKSVYRCETLIKANETSRLAQIKDLKDGTTEVLAYNSFYNFRLKSGKNDQWILIDFNRRDERISTKASELEKRLELRALVDVDQVVRFHPDNQFIGDILFSSRCRIMGANRKTRDGKELVELEFEVTPDPNEPRQLLGGTLLLDSDRNWLPVAQTTKVRNRVGTSVYTTEWEFGPATNPLPSRTVEQMVFTPSSPGEQWHATYTTESNLHIPATLPEDHEFTLSAFGLPEPVGVKWPKPKSNSYLFLSGAAGFVVLAILFGYLRRRAAAAGKK